MISSALLRRFGLLGLLALLSTLPFALPAFWDVVRMRWGGEPGTYLYLLKPVENQYAYLLIGAATVGLSFTALSIFSLSDLRFRPRPISLCILLLLAVQLISAWRAPVPAYCYRMLLLPFVFYFGYVLVQRLQPDTTATRKTYFLLLLGAALAGLYAVAQNRGYEILPYSRTMEGSQDEITGKQLIASTFGHPNYMGSYIGPLVFWAFYFILLRGAGLIRLVSAACGLLILAGLIVGGTRGPWLGVLLAGVPFYFLIALSPVYRRPLLFAAGLALVVAVVFLLVPNKLVHVQFDVQKRLVGSKEVAARFYYWLMAIEMLKSHPLLGVGYGNFDVNFWDYVDAYQRRPQSEYFRYVLQESIRGIRPLFVHNDHLQIATESGILGALVWLALWTTLIIQAFRSAARLAGSHANLLLGATLIASLLCFAIDGLTNFPLHVPVSGMLFWVTLGMWTQFYERTCCVESTSSSPAEVKA